MAKATLGPETAQNSPVDRLGRNQARTRHTRARSMLKLGTAESAKLSLASSGHGTYVCLTTLQGNRQREQGET